MDEDTDYRPQKKRAHGLESHDNSPPFGGDFEAFQIAVEAVKHGHIAETEKQNEDQRDEFGRIQWQGAVGRVGHGIVNLLPERMFSRPAMNASMASGMDRVSRIQLENRNPVRVRTMAPCTMSLR